MLFKSSLLNDSKGPTVDDCEGLLCGLGFNDNDLSGLCLEKNEEVYWNFRIGRFS